MPSDTIEIEDTEAPGGDILTGGGENTGARRTQRQEPAATVNDDIDLNDDDDSEDAMDSADSDHK